MKFNTNNIHRSSKLLEIIVKNKFYNCGANGDIVLMAALTRFICFCFQFDKASYCHIKAWKYKNKAVSNDGIISDSDETLQYFNIQDAFLGYNSCYDTLLQAIKFAFQLVPELKSKNDFVEALKDCKWGSDGKSIGIKELLLHLTFEKGPRYSN